MKEIISDHLLEQLELKTLQESDETSKMDWLFSGAERSHGVATGDNLLYLSTLCETTYCYLFPLEIGKKKIFLLKDLATDLIVGYYGNENFLEYPEENLMHSFKLLIEVKKKNIFTDNKNIDELKKINLMIYSNSEILNMNNFMYSMDGNKFFHLSKMKSLEFFLEGEKSSLDQQKEIIEHEIKSTLVSCLIEYNKDICKKLDYLSESTVLQDYTRAHDANYQNLFLEECNESQILSMMKLVILMLNTEISQNGSKNKAAMLKRYSRIRNTIDKMLSDILKDLKV